MAKPPGSKGHQEKGTTSQAHEASRLLHVGTPLAQEQGHPGPPAGDGGTQPTVQAALAEGLEARTALPAPFRHAAAVHRGSQHLSPRSLLWV